MMFRVTSEAPVIVVVDFFRWEEALEKREITSFALCCAKSKRKHDLTSSRLSIKDVGPHPLVH